MIKIPQSNANEQAKNELVQWVLDNIKDRKSVGILQRTEGCCAGNWCGWSPYDGDWHKASFEIVKEVVREFRKQGWLVTETNSWRYPSAHITFER